VIAPIDPNDDEETGGLGGNLRPVGTRDTRLLDRAVRENWPIPEEYRKPVVDRMYDIVTDSKTKAREASIAARVLVAMEQQNQAERHKAIDKLVPDAAQQINIYVPDNGREAYLTTNIAAGGGKSNGNGRH
jgi:hypothetical protein